MDTAKYPHEIVLGWIKTPMFVVIVILIGLTIMSQSLWQSDIGLSGEIVGGIIVVVGAIWLNRV
jgi:membrane-bound ClpP family serine protease